jgi:hypothetical protein
MMAGVEKTVPVLLFGAYDRHNFGDMLFAHVVSSLLADRPLYYAGLRARDLRSNGGSLVHGIARFAAEWGERPIHVLHVGGELLTCETWQAAVMLQSVEQAAAVIARLDAQHQERLAWAQDQVGLAVLAPYVLSRDLLPGVVKVLYTGVGGVELDRVDADMRAEVLAKLREADGVGVRDRVTLVHLQQAGIPARLMPDPAVLVVELFGRVIDQHAKKGEIARLSARWPYGYLAVQFSADFGDDATLRGLAKQLTQVTRACGCGVVLFRAGAAPWHDNLDLYQRLAKQMPDCLVEIFTALDVWDICALIAGSRGFIGSSLHGRIVAMACALPRLNFMRSGMGGLPSKQQAYVATWETAGLPGCVELDDIVPAALAALAIDPELMRYAAKTHANHYREEFAALCAGLLT